MNELDTYLKYDIDKLYQNIGIDTTGFIAKSVRVDYLIDKGKEFVSKNIDRIKSIICPHKDKILNDYADISIIITSLVAALKITEFACYSIVAVIIKRGIDNICSS